MGTTLFSLGLARGQAPELWNVERPEQVRGIQHAYVQAGAQIILTNSFGGNRLRLERHDLGARTRELNRAAAELACAEADAASEPVLVAASVGPTGSLLTPLGELTPDAAYYAFEEQASALVSGGVDALWLETFSDLAEAKIAVEAARSAAPQHPIVLTMTFDTHGHTSMGVAPETAMQAFSDWGENFWAVGANCGNGPAEIEHAIASMHAFDPAATLVSKANAGMPRLKAGRTVYEASPDEMARHAREVYLKGARIIGACCGSTPDHIRAMGQALQEAAESN
jgi:5-methyltetrahydrofolate--homocysteine methyltransferase